MAVNADVRWPTRNPQPWREATTLPPRSAPIPGADAAPIGGTRAVAALLVALLLVSALSLLYMSQAANLATSGYEISNLQAQRDTLQRENEDLSVQLAQLSSLPHIEQVATTRLNMTKSDLAHVRYVSLSPNQLAQSAK